MNSMLFCTVSDCEGLSIRTGVRGIQFLWVCCSCIATLSSPTHFAASGPPECVYNDSTLDFFMQAVATEFQNESAAALAAAATRHLQEAEQAKNSGNEHWWGDVSSLTLTDSPSRPLSLAQSQSLASQILNQAALSPLRFKAVSLPNLQTLKSSDVNFCSPPCALWDFSEGTDLWVKVRDDNKWRHWGKV